MRRLTVITIALGFFALAAMPAQAHWELAGITDFYCVSFFGLHLAFPFVNGSAQVTPS